MPATSSGFGLKVIAQPSVREAGCLQTVKLTLPVHALLSGLQAAMPTLQVHAMLSPAVNCHV